VPQDSYSYSDSSSDSSDGIFVNEKNTRKKEKKIANRSLQSLPKRTRRQLAISKEHDQADINEAIEPQPRYARTSRKGSDAPSIPSRPFSSPTPASYDFSLPTTARKLSTSMRGGPSSRGGSNGAKRGGSSIIPKVALASNSELTFCAHRSRCYKHFAN
jgi:hypothetical protein